MHFSLVFLLLVPALLHCACADEGIPEDVQREFEDEMADQKEEEIIEERDARLPIEDEKAMLKRHADTYDLNRDGMIDTSEAEKIFGKRTGNDILSRADEDGDNGVTLDEFVGLLQKLTHKDSDGEQHF